MFNKKFKCIEIDMEKKLFVLEPDTFTVTNRILFNGTITDTENGYIIEGEQQEAAVHDKDFTPVNPELVEDRFVNEYDVKRTRSIWKWKWGLIPLPYWKTIETTEKEVKPGWVLLKSRKHVVVTIMERFTMIVELKGDVKKVVTKKEDKEDVVKDDGKEKKSKFNA